MEPRQWFVGSLGPLVFVAGCEAILGIEDGKLRTFCSGKPEGTLLPNDLQTMGDCSELVCDGEGCPKQVPAPDDNDDGNPCTIDSCDAQTPVHAKQVHIPCYTGPLGTNGVGVCKGGILQCDVLGKPSGSCVGETAPAELDGCNMNDNIDDDCDGAVDEDCHCGDGKVQSEFGEECDDGARADGDPCSSICRDQRILSVGAGSTHTCALLSGGVVKCWGNNSYGQLGIGDLANRGDQADEMGRNLPAVNFGAGRNAVVLAVGGIHTCAILNDGSVRCWGLNEFGQLGVGNTLNSPLPAPAVNLGDGKSAIALGAGRSHTCAVLSDGSVQCWGRNDYGQLGIGSTNDQLSPVWHADLGDGKKAVAIAAGYAHTCARLDDGSVKCWGHNTYGELGIGNTTYQSSPSGPIDWGNGITVEFLALGYEHTCAVLNDDTLKCSGLNAYGELGNGNTMNQSLPVGPVIVGIKKEKGVLAGGWRHTCAILNDSSIKCWGCNFDGQLGIGNTMNLLLPTNEVYLGASQAASLVALGYYHTCVLLLNGSLKCWGANGNGQLGLGDTNTRGDEPGEMGDKLPTVKLFSDVW